MVNGHTKDILIDTSGAVVEVEEQVELRALPEAVQAGLARERGGEGSPRSNPSRSWGGWSRTKPTW